jgi:hypothetical protein
MIPNAVPTWLPQLAVRPALEQRVEEEEQPDAGERVWLTVSTVVTRERCPRSSAHAAPNE